MELLKTLAVSPARKVEMMMMMMTMRILMMIFFLPGLNQVLPGVAQLIEEVQVEGTFPDGTKLVRIKKQNKKKQTMKPCYNGCLYSALV